MRWWTPALILAVIGATVAVESAALHGQLIPSVADGVVGATLLTCGVLSWRLRSARRVSVLMLLSGGMLPPSTQRPSFLWPICRLIQN